MATHATKRHDLDFDFVRAHSDFGTVLTHYKIEQIGDGEQVKALCPFHSDTRPSLNVNTRKNVFKCNPCGEGGNILDFVMKMEDMKPRPAGIKLAEICGIPKKDGGKVNGATKAKPKSKTRKAEPEVAGDEEDGLTVGFNKPLSFELKLDMQPYHPWLESRGIAPGMVEEFGVGLANRGSMEGRLAIPIHNEHGKLVAYCGRYPADEIPEDEPKYLLPKGFKKELELFNLHRIPKGASGTVLLVESYLSVMKHWKKDVPVVCPMGRSISPQQIDKLKRWGVSRVAILFDGDKPGREGAQEVAGAIAGAGMWAKVGHVPDGVKPHQMTYKELLSCFNQ